VSLLNPSGGASLGQGSAVVVMIDHSDGAFGIFQFGPLSRGVQARETGDSGFNTVPLQVYMGSGDIKLVEEEGLLLGGIVKTLFL